VDEILGQVLRNAVWERLDMLTDAAAGPRGAAPARLARGEVLRLAEHWRSLLAAHEPDERGNCPECSSRWRQQRSPCAIWRCAYDHLIDGGLAARPTKQGPRPGVVEPSRRMAPAS
jgi:ribosomal protein L37AE/L43A